MSYKRMYPPWYEIVSLLYYTIGADPQICIMEPECVDENHYTMGICVGYRQQADYLRMIIPTEYRTGNYVIGTQIFCNDEEICLPCIPQKNQRDVANLFCNALRTNPLFRGVLLVPQPFIPLKSCVQVCVVKDYVPTCGGHGQMSVADAFAQVVKLHYGTLMATEVYFKCCTCHELNGCCLYCEGNYISK